jgi:hypothetical protein
VFEKLKVGAVETRSSFERILNWGRFLQEAVPTIVSSPDARKTLNLIFHP